jgi:hypothetical protein
MQTIPTADDITARRSVRFAAGHLAGHADWTGTLVGYSDLYDTVHVYVSAPGNSESGSKITYSRKDVEWDEPAPVEHRETTVRVAGVERVVRTEVGGKIRTVKQLEAAHTKAVKAAIIEMRIAAAPDSMPHEMAERLAKRATQFPACNWDAAVRPLRALRTEDPTTYLVEVEPGHWATEDAAEMLFALEAESVDEPAEVEHMTVGRAEFLASLLDNVAA